MDKKTKCVQPSPNKGTATDSKKNQDVSGKAFPKTSKRREPPGTNGCSKSEAPRKSGVQKARISDKRPKPKGQYYGGAKENTKVNQELAEHGSVMVPGSKKQNLNHLLNFHYEPRLFEDGCGGYARPSTNYNSNRWLPPVQRHEYNKELFLQANCQFVVNISGDYSVYLVDPDILVDWKLIEQIKIHTSERLSCPICLSWPVAGRMTRCGHVYCWPCILHYLSLSDTSWRKCPICYESVHKSDLKSVVEVTQKPVNIGDSVRLRLMRRKRGSLLATPVTDTESVDPETYLALSEPATSQIHSKLLLARITDILKLLKCEQTQLQIKLREDPDSPGNCFIEQALEELAQREQSVLVRNEGSVATSDTDGAPEKVNPLSQECIETSVEDVTSAQGSQKYFYFYQAEDGQHVYLHAMNAKMLELQYGSLENCPREISGKLLEKESGSFTEDLRRRLRYLCHLPLTCSFEIAEIEMTKLISAEVLDLFREQLDGRVRRRRRQKREEKKREKKINVEENKKLGRYPKQKWSIESRRNFPQLPESVGKPPESVASSSLASSPPQTSFEENSVPATSWPPSQGDKGPSFAEMLRNKGSGMSSAKIWPAMGSAKSTRTSRESAVDDDDDLAAAPVPNQCLGDLLACALERSEMMVTSGSRKSRRK